MPLRPGVTLERFRERGIGRLPALIGVRFTGVTEHRVDAELDIRPELLAPNGYLHAATVIALADTACGYGCLAHLPEGAENFTTIELKTNFLGTMREGRLACVASAVHLGKTTQVWDAVVSDPARVRKLALFRCTQMVLWPSGKRSA
ncbi:MAG TPA: PaaI family thioesterase [Casimicrobiaceae bacterium]|nr:PaaI family thioesterase [Casimicrobiaceae bacterium]